MVAVLSSTGIRLMPTTRYKARELINKGKAVIFQYRPFTIKLTQREDGYTQPIECCVDTGYKHIGISVKSEKHEYVGEQIDLLLDEKQKHDNARKLRRTRRNKKRYRKPRFDNRKSSKPKGWLAPSIQHKKEVHERQIAKLIEVMPITDVTLEMGEFDTQKLKAFEEGKEPPVGVDYQRGEQYGFTDVRNAVFTRDNYTCAVCGKTIKDGVILVLHHLIFRKYGGTNRPGNLITVCTNCHTPANHKPGGPLWKLMETYKVPEFKGATFMTAVRWQMWNELVDMFPNIAFHMTYGSTTKDRRHFYRMEKSHINDAYVMGMFHPRHRTQHYLYKKIRRNNRVLSKFYDAKYIDTRDGKVKKGAELFNGRTNRNHNRDTENLHQYRGQKISKGRTSTRTQHYPIQPGDTVLYQAKKYVAKGIQNNGTRVILDNKKSVSVKKVKVIRYANGYVQTALERKAELKQAII